MLEKVGLLVHDAIAAGAMIVLLLLALFALYVVATALGYQPNPEDCDQACAHARGLVESLLALL